MTELEIDGIQRFKFTDLAVRGSIIRLQNSWQEVRRRANPAAAAEHVFGELLAATALIRNGLKDSERFYSEFTGGHYIKSMIADARTNGTIRGLVVANGDDDTIGQGVLKNTRLLLAVEKNAKQYQSVVEVVDDDITATLEHYFQQSEQLSTRLILAANAQQCGGFMLQSLPDSDADDEWRRLSLLLNTLGKDELLKTDNQTLLRRLFNEDSIKLFDADPVSFGCSCSHDRAYNVIANLTREDVDEVLEQDGHIGITCEFCGQQYVYRRADLSIAFPHLIEENERIH